VALGKDTVNTPNVQAPLGARHGSYSMSRDTVHPTVDGGRMKDTRPAKTQLCVPVRSGRE
jgi:hypothetical protein